MVEVGGEAVPGELLAAPEELDGLGPDGLLEISLKVNLSTSLGKKVDHYVLGRSLTVKWIEVTQLPGPAGRLSCCHNLIG